MSQLLSFFRTGRNALGSCARRFPVTLVFALALVALQTWVVATDGRGDGRLLSTLFYFLSVGTVLSLSLHLWSEEVKSRKLRLGVLLVAPVLLAVDAVFLYHNIEGTRTTEIVIAHGAAILAIGLSVFFLSFFRERNDIPAWNFAQTAVSTLAITLVVGMVMSGGLCLLAFSLYQLFGVNVSHECYLYILIWCGELLPLLMFLGLLPEGERKHDRLPQPTDVLQSIHRYLFVPLAGLYLLVLYVYAATIIVRWQLPDGWVSWLVTVLMAGIIAIETGLYPSRIRDGRRMDERIARWLPLLALPLLVLMTVGIGRRFMDYGITINRLYLVTLNGWFYFVCIGLIAGRARRLSWIPISFSLVFLVTSVLPVNYASITRHTLRGEVREALTQGGQADSLPLSTEAYETWLFSLPPEEAARLNSKCNYLREWFGAGGTRDLVAVDTPFYSYEPKVTGDTVTVEEPDFFYAPDCYTLPVPHGYRYCTHFSGSGQGDSLAYRITLVNGRIAPDTLRNHDQQHTSPPPVLRTQGGNLFVLTYFHNSYTITEIENDTARWNPCLEVKGLLFHNDH